MRHTLRLATGAGAQQAERERAPGSGKFREEGSRLRAPPRGGPAARGRGPEAREAPSPARPGNAASRARTGPRPPAGDLPAHRLVGQLAHAIELLLHRGQAAARARELRKDGAARSPPQGYMAPERSLPGDGGGTAEPPGAFWPARGSLPRAPAPTPPPAAAPAAASSSSAPPRLHRNARGRLESRPGPLGCAPPAPVPRWDPRVSAGWLARWPGGPRAPVRRAPSILGLVVSHPCAHLSSDQSLQVQWGAEVGEGCVHKGFAL